MCPRERGSDAVQLSCTTIPSHWLVPFSILFGNIQKHLDNDLPIQVVAPDRQGMARGTLYLDDGKSFEYKQGRKVYVEITWDNGRLESKIIESGIEIFASKLLLFQALLASTINLILSRHGHTCLAGEGLGAGCKTKLWSCTGGKNYLKLCFLHANKKQLSYNI